MTEADLVVMTLNVHTTSDPRGVEEWLEGVVDDYAPTHIALQELTSRHIRALRHLPGYTLFVDRDEPGSGDTGWLVKDALDVRYVAAKQMTRDGWWGWRTNRQHTPRFMAVLRITRPNWLPLGSVHTPPGVDVTSGGLTGPRDRRRAWRQYMRSLRRWAEKRQRFILIGDWNERPSRLVHKWSPSWLAQKVGAEIAGTGTIDFVMVKGAEVVARFALQTPADVDHDAHIFYVDLV